MLSDDCQVLEQQVMLLNSFVIDLISFKFLSLLWGMSLGIMF